MGQGTPRVVGSRTRAQMVVNGGSGLPIFAAGMMRGPLLTNGPLLDARYRTSEISIVRVASLVPT